VAQAAHAAVAAVWLHRDDPHTVAYCSPERLDAMHKACARALACFGLTTPSTLRVLTFPFTPALAPQVVLEVKGEPQLRTLSAALSAAGVAHKLWTEQPEDFATCLATKPYPKSAVAAHFKKLNLCK
jgi:hypothetical protein